MILTESELRELWRDGRHQLPAFPAGTRFSPSAHDFIKDHQLEIRFAEPAPIPLSAPQLPTPAPSASVGVTNYQLPSTLDALALLVAAEARRYQLPAWRGGWMRWRQTARRCTRRRNKGATRRRSSQPQPAARCSRPDRPITPFCTG